MHMELTVQEDNGFQQTVNAHTEILWVLWNGRKQKYYRFTRSTN